MSLLRDIRPRVRRVAPQVLAAAIVAYFAYHAVHGGKGIKAWIRLSDDLASAKAEQATLVARRQELEARVNLLRREHLAPDMLKERALSILNYGHPEEFIILLPEESQFGERGSGKALDDGL